MYCCSCLGCIVVSYVYCCHLSCVYGCSCLVCILLVVLCVLLVVLCVLLLVVLCVFC